MHGDRQLEATAQLFGLSRGYLTMDDVIAWADRVILESRTASREIVDVATSPKETGELRRRLHALIGSFDSEPDRRSVLKSMRDTLVTHPERAAYLAAALVHLFAGGDDPAASEAHHVDYAFELADDHVQGNRESATEELRTFLEKWG